MSTTLEIITAIPVTLSALAALLGALRRLGLRWSRRPRPRRRLPRPVRPAAAPA